MKGEMHWHTEPVCVKCERRLRDGETAFPVTGERNGVVCFTCLVRITPKPGAGYTLRVGRGD